MKITICDTTALLPLELRIHARINDSSGADEIEVSEVEIWCDGLLRSDDNALESFSQATQKAILAACYEHQLEGEIAAYDAWVENQAVMS